MKQQAKRKLPLETPLMRKAFQALKEAARGAWIEHKQKGLPLYILKNNKVVAILQILQHTSQKPPRLV